MKERRKRNQTLGEEIGNAVTHGVGFLIALLGTTLLFIKANDWRAYLGVGLFSFGLIVLYIMSTLYHSFPSGSKVKRIFRHFDHCSIYLLIGGTYAPILLVEKKGAIGWIFFAIQWALIIWGIVMKAVFDPGRNIVIHTIIYLLLGWSGIVFLPYMLNNNLPLFWFIFMGGISYSAGVVFFSVKFKYAHFVWHFFVMLGTLLHFFGIYFFVLS